MSPSPSAFILSSFVGPLMVWDADALRRVASGWLVRGATVAVATALEGFAGGLHTSHTMHGMQRLSSAVKNVDHAWQKMTSKEEIAKMTVPVRPWQSEQLKLNTCMSRPCWSV